MQCRYRPLSLSIRVDCAPLRQRAVIAPEINQRRASFLMPGKAQHTSNQDGVIAGFLHALECAFEHRQRIGQRRRPQFRLDQRDAVEANVRPGRARRADTSLWPVPRMLTVKPVARAKRSWRCERRSMHHSTKGGSSDTEVKEFTVMPICATVCVCAAGGHHRHAGRKTAQRLSKSPVSKSMAIANLKQRLLHTRLRGVMHDPPR